MSTTSTDPIADMFSRIRNALAVNKTEITLPHSNIKESVAKLLKENRFIDDVKVTDASIGKTLKLILTGPYESSRITEIVRLSKPGRRQYADVKEIPTVKRGRGLVIVSTSKGIMTGDDARKNRIGGELICRIY